MKIIEWLEDFTWSCTWHDTTDIEGITIRATGENDESEEHTEKDQQSTTNCDDAITVRN